MNDFTETVATPHSGRVGVPPPTVAADGDGTPSLPSFATAANDSTITTRADTEGGMTMEEARSYCLKLECDRERKWRQTTRQGRFESAMQSLDALRDSFEDPSKAAFSDGGAGTEAVIDYCDEVFDLIVKNSSNRTESICQMTLSKR